MSTKLNEKAPINLHKFQYIDSQLCTQVVKCVSSCIMSFYGDVLGVYCIVFVKHFMVANHSVYCSTCTAAHATRLCNP